MGPNAKVDYRRALVPFCPLATVVAVAVAVTVVSRWLQVQVHVQASCRCYSSQCYYRGHTLDMQERGTEIPVCVYIHTYI